MKVGILTFSRSTNYGAQLQAWALMGALRSLGNSVVFLNRYDNMHLGQIKAGNWSRSLMWRIKDKVVGCLFWILGVDLKSSAGRALSSSRFCENYLPHTDFSFYRWEEIDAAKWCSLGLDLVIVGSDQVWNCEWKNLGPDLGVYLLEGAPSVRAIAYAASFGMKKIPDSLRTRYADGFKRFGAISTREREGVDLVASVGGAAVHVCDPTLLLDIKSWVGMIGNAPTSGDRRIVMYFISYKWNDDLDVIDAFARRHNVEIVLFGGSARIKKIRPLKMLWGYVKEGWYLRCGRVRIMECAGADEFARQLAYADAVVTDSFHALMLSAIFHRNVRVITPKDAGRQGMFARIEEFACRYIKGPWQSDDIASALSSVASEQMTFDDDRINEFRERSMEWLKNALTIK